MGRRGNTSYANESKAEGPQTKLIVHYCICGEFVLVIDKPLKVLPRRPVDASFVLRNRESQTDSEKKANVYKLNVRVEKIPVLMRRPNGLEKLYRTRCTRCDLQVGYETVDPQFIKEKGEKVKGEFSYLLDGALTENQARLPQGAFEERVGMFAVKDKIDEQMQEA